MYLTIGLKPNHTWKFSGDKGDGLSGWSSTDSPQRGKDVQYGNQSVKEVSLCLSRSDGKIGDS